MARNSFDKFINTGTTGAKKKEQIRQEKKKARDEKNAYFDKLKQEKKIQREGQRSAPPRENEARSADDRRPGKSKPYGKSSGKSFDARSKPDRSFNSDDNSGTGRPARSYKSDADSAAGRPARSYKSDNDSPARKPARSYSSDDAPAPRKPAYGKPAYGKSAPGTRTPGAFGNRKPAGRTSSTEDSRSSSGKKSAYGKPLVKKEERKGGYAGKPKPSKAATDITGTLARSAVNAKAKAEAAKAAIPAKAEAYKDGVMPLNKYIAHAGVCSRRDAADLVKSGKVHVNGKPVLEPGFKVTIKDEVKVHGKQVVATRNFVYILLNKPKDFLTTTDDPEGRKTVMDIIKSATTERVYPIGRLDRNTTGVLLLTNDGELAQKLSHPSYEVKKIYEVKLDKPLLKKDFDRIIAGVQLEDGMVAPDVLAYADSKDKSVIGIEIHSGKNRIVRRIFEHVGYDVRNLDRVMYANLTKKNVERGKWRFLSEKEVRLLKFLNASYTKKPDAKPAR